MYRILRHGSRIPGLSEEYSRAFPRSGMKFRHTSKTLCCRVWWSQIWHRTHIPFNGQFWPAATHHYHMLPLPGTPLNDSFCSIWSIFSSFLTALNLCLPAHTASHLSDTKLLGAGSVSNGSKFPGRFRVRFQPGTEPLQRVSIQNPLLKSQHFLLRLSIWVLIVSQHEQYVDCAVLVAPLPPAFRFAIRQVLVESRSKTRQFRWNSAFISQPLNEYQSDRKSARGRWKSD